MMEDTFDGLFLMVIGFFITVPFAIWKWNCDNLACEVDRKALELRRYNISMVYAYLRVSTDKQDGINQKRGVDALAVARGFTIDEYIDDEGKSGTRRNPLLPHRRRTKTQ